MIYLRKAQGVLELENKDRESILETFRRNHIEVFAYCGGKGTCGKCKVRVVQGEIPACDEDQLVFTTQELDYGMRLACKAYPQGDCTIEYEEEMSYEALGSEGVKTVKNKTVKKEKVALAIDIGTTTIAVSAIDLNQQNIFATRTAINPLRSYGADVISRIDASNSGAREEMKEKLRSYIVLQIIKIAQDEQINENCIDQIVLSGNTTMGHLLMGFSCEGLGNFPFTPVEIGFIEGSAKEILGTDRLSKCNVVMLPGISTYVGADITAGMMYCGFNKCKEICLLIDLGTNGEMVIGNKEQMLVTSTAAGPAFEGGNITYGCGSIAGAICGATINENKMQVQTIGGGAARGICGTGVVEILSELLEAGVVDDTGLLEEQYFDTGYPVAVGENGEPILFTQKDIRELQLAKAAICAGVMTLIIRYGITCEEIHSVYLAGGFGYKLDVKKAVRIGLLPKELEGKIKAVGNSSLLGAFQYACQWSKRGGVVRERWSQIVERCEEVNLSLEDQFNDFFMEYMCFL